MGATFTVPPLLLSDAFSGYMGCYIEGSHKSIGWGKLREPLFQES